MNAQWDGKVVISTPGGQLIEMSLGEYVARKNAEVEHLRAENERLRENVDRLGKEIERLRARVEVFEAVLHAIFPDGANINLVRKANAEEAKP